MDTREMDMCISHIPEITKVLWDILIKHPAPKDNDDE